MTISPVKFGWIYAVNGSAAERKQTRTDIAAYAAKQSPAVDVEVLPDVDADSDLYFTNDTNGGKDADTFRAHKAEVERYFELRRHSIDSKIDELKKTLTTRGSIAPVHRVDYEKVVDAIATDATTNHIGILAQMYGFSVTSLQSITPAANASASVGRDTFNADYGYAR